MSAEDEVVRTDDRGEAPGTGYEKPAIVWEQVIDVRRLSVGCTRQEYNLECVSLGQPFGS